MNSLPLMWLAADYHLSSTYSCRVPMSSMNSALALPTPGPATVRLALIRAGIEVFGLEYVRDELFPQIRALKLQIRPPERVGISWQVLHAYKVDEQAEGIQVNTAPISREVCQAQGPLTVYLEVPVQETRTWSEILRAIGYWGQASSLAYCTKVYQNPPNHDECITPLSAWKRSGPLRPYFTCVLSEFRASRLIWDDVVPAVGTQQAEMLRMEIYVWPMVITEQHGRGKLLLRTAFTK